MSLTAALGKYGTRCRYCSEADYSETVGLSFRILLSKLIIYIRGAYILLAELGFAAAEKPTVRFSTLSNLLIRLSGSASLATLHIPSLNRGPSRLQHTLGKIWCPLTSSCNGATLTEVPLTSTVTRGHADERRCDDKRIEQRIQRRTSAMDIVQRRSGMPWHFLRSMACLITVMKQC
jgi:hypothetical protein